MNQNDIRKRLKIAKIEQGKDGFSYSDVAAMLDLKSVGSIYNFLNSQYDLSQKKARYLESWLSDMGY